MRAVVEAGDVVAIWESELAAVPAWSLVLRGRGVDVDVRGDLAYSGASTIKTFLLEQASHAVEAGSLSWDSAVSVTPEHVAVGDGVLATWPLPVTLPLHAVAQLMTALSDNTATNAVVDTLGGLEVVNDALAAAECTSRMRRWVTGRYADPRCDAWDSSPSLPSRAGLSVVVPREHAAAIDRMVTEPRHARRPRDARAAVAPRLAGPAASWTRRRSRTRPAAWAAYGMTAACCCRARPRL